MKILVLGNSNSNGSRLADPRDSWPRLIERDLGGLGIETKVVDKLFIAGPTGAAFLDGLLERERPDVAIFPTSTFGIVVELVSYRVRERFGVRAATVVGRAERFVARRTPPPGGRGGRLILEARRAGRRLVGTRPALSVDAAMVHFDQCLMSLARAENTHTIVLGGPGYSRELERLNPNLRKLQDRCQAHFQESAQFHHFDWLSHEELLGGQDAKQQYFFSDGIHHNERSHLLVAGALLPLVLARA